MNLIFVEILALLNVLELLAITCSRKQPICTTLFVQCWSNPVKQLHIQQLCIIWFILTDFNSSFLLFLCVFCFYYYWGSAELGCIPCYSIYRIWVFFHLLVICTTLFVQRWSNPAKQLHIQQLCIIWFILTDFILIIFIIFMCFLFLLLFCIYKFYFFLIFYSLIGFFFFVNFFFLLKLFYCISLSLFHFFSFLFYSFLWFYLCIGQQGFSKIFIESQIDFG